jgi:MoaA/NifB/PqqE/SkfB family radical SAM enzyme
MSAFTDPSVLEPPQVLTWVRNMRSERVFTNYRCNQHCTYCSVRQESDDLQSIQPARLRAQIDAQVDAGAAQIVLTGGEPTLRRDLPSLVAHARGRGARVAVETNATQLDDSAAQALAAAGVTTVLVNLSGVGEALDAVTRDPGGFARTLEGLRALVRVGLAVEIGAVLVRSTRDLLPALPDAIVAALADLATDGAPRPIRAFVLTLPVESPEAGELLTYEEAVPIIQALEARVRAHGIPLRLNPDAAPPPCVFPSGARLNHFYTLSGAGDARAPRPGQRKLAACAGCLVDGACAGFAEAYLARHGVPSLQPIVEERARRRLSIISSVEEQQRRELVTPSRKLVPGHGLVEESIIRVQFHCNQSCAFCFVSTHLPAMDDADVRAAIVEAGARGHKIVLSGGEPTLHPRLVEYVALAHAHSRFPVELQTNAVRLDDPALVESLRAAGLAEAFVSLHGATAERSDAVTQAPGTFARTVVGIDQLVRTPIRVQLNFVLCGANYTDLPAMIRLCATRWPRAAVCISFIAPSSDVVPRDRRLVPRYSDVLPFVAEALALAHALKVAVHGFESMCGLPLCLVPAGRFADELAEIPPGFDGGEFLKTDACRRCGLESRCYGVRRGYAELHGTDELRPVEGARA